eukprot:6214131-Pleurochrysis_carterae.AAC.1
MTAFSEAIPSNTSLLNLVRETFARPLRSSDFVIGLIARPADGVGFGHYDTDEKATAVLALDAVSRPRRGQFDRAQAALQ